MPAGLAHNRIQFVDVRLNLLTAALIHDLASHHAAHKRLPGARGCQCAPDAMRAFTQNHFDAVGALVQHHDLHQLAGFGDAHFYFFVGHGILRKFCCGRQALPEDYA